ncbi:unnamed protein product [Lactuca virosa]|uniref:Calmodulin-binding domain-containing protein n=1 Tax=Lactuca virosa TaxID=75947 RepID=A0AAU9LF86_9ASTR|nr:unnamed protein product [Lactuca virosa]
MHESNKSPEKIVHESTKSPKKLETAAVVVSTAIIKLVEPVDDTVVAEKLPSKSGVFLRLKKRSRGSRKSSDVGSKFSPSNVRKPQLSHQGVIFREVPVPVSPLSKKRRAEDVANHISKKKKRQRKLKLNSILQSQADLGSNSSVTHLDVDNMLKTFEGKVVSKVSGMVRDSEIRLLERIDHNDQNDELRVNSLNSMFKEEVKEFKNVVKERHVLFVQDVKKVREDVNLQIQEL